MRKKIELLSPAGNMEALIAAVSAGCDAVYLGCTNFSARAFAGNFNHEELLEAVKYCHIRDVRVYVTMNTLIYETEMEQAMKEVDFLYHADVDALLIQDYGLFHRIRVQYPDFELHCSTQMHIHNPAGCLFMKEQGAGRAVLARESSIETVRACAKTGMEIEVFAYGALCVSYSGQCLMSSSVKNRSGNRGVCAQMCRLRFYPSEKSGRVPSSQGEFALAMKDLNVLERLPELIEAGAGSLKIEGRMKKSEYVYLVTRTFREAIDAYYAGKSWHLSKERKSELERLFNRGFTEGYLFHDSFARRMSMDRPNHRGVPIGKVLRYKDGRVLVRLSGNLTQHDGLRIINEPIDTGLTAVKIETRGKLVSAAKAGEEVWLECRSKPIPKPGQTLLKTSDTALLEDLRREQRESERKISVHVTAEGSADEPLKLSGTDSSGNTVLAFSDQPLQKAQKAPLSEERIRKALEKTAGFPYEADIEIRINGDVFLPVNELNETRRKLYASLSEVRARRHLRGEALPYTVSSIEDVPFGKPLIILDEREEKNRDRSELAMHRLPVVNEKESDKMAVVKSVISNAGDLWMDLSHCTAGLTFNITNSWTMEYLLSMPGIDALILSSECTDELIAAMMKGFEERTGKKANAYQLVYGRRPMMFIKEYPFEHPYLTDLEGRMYPLINSDGCTVILENEPYRRANRSCRGSCLIFTLESREESEAIKEEAYEEVFGRI